MNLPDKPIAVGRTAEVFAWGDGRVVKLIRPDFPQSLADQEWTYASTAWSLGISVPRPFELIEVDGRRGVVFERIDAPSMAYLMAKYPQRVTQYGRLLAQVQARLHTLHVPTFPSLVDRSWHSIIQSRLFSPNLKDRLLNSLLFLPNDDRLCHGDIHPDNILITDHGPVLIDWEGCMRGPAMADVANSRVILTTSTVALTGLKGRVVHWLIRAFDRAYLIEYQRLAKELALPAPIDSLPAWMNIQTAARLDEAASEVPPLVLPSIERGW